MFKNNVLDNKLKNKKLLSISKDNNLIDRNSTILEDCYETKSFDSHSNKCIEDKFPKSYYKQKINYCKRKAIQYHESIRFHLLFAVVVRTTCQGRIIFQRNNELIVATVFPTPRVGHIATSKTQYALLISSIRRAFG